MPSVYIEAEDATARAGHPTAGITLKGTGPVTVTRTVGTTVRPVRSVAPGTRIAGELFVEDHECPVSVEVTSRLVAEDGQEATATITLPDGGAMWLSDPLDWTSSIRLGTQVEDWYQGGSTIQRDSLTGTVRTLQGREVLPLGARVPVVLGGVRLAPQDVPLALRTTGADTLGLVSLLDAGGVLLLRGSGLDAGLVAPGGAMYFVGDWTATSILTTGEVLWSCRARQVAPPSALISVTRYTYAGVHTMTLGMTYAEVRSRAWGATYAQVRRTPERVSR